MMLTNTIAAISNAVANNKSMRLNMRYLLTPSAECIAVQGSRMLLGRAPCDSVQEDQASGPFTRAFHLR